MRSLILYAESSAVLAWLLGGPSGQAAREALAAAETVMASDLTLVECDRALIRGAATGEIARAEAVRVHLATALLVAAEIPGLVLLSFDQRIRRAATELGLDVAPA